jgi:hypothetical protein
MRHRRKFRRNTRRRGRGRGRRIRYSVIARGGRRM